MGSSTRKILAPRVARSRPFIQWVRLSRYHTRLLSVGRGEPVIFLHCYGGSLEHWSYCILPLRRHFTLYAFDLPGFGYSPHPTPPPTISDYVDCVRALVEKEKLERVHLVGNSLGGLVAARSALALKEGVKSLTLVDSAGFSFLLHLRGAGPMAALFFQLARFAGVKPPEALVRQIIYFCFAKPSPQREALADQFLRYLREKDMRSWLSVLTSVARSLLREHLKKEAKKIAVRTLVVWGRNDRVLPWNDALYALHEIPNSRGVVFQECGHFPHIERSHDFVEILRDFLQRKPLKKWRVL